MTPESRPHIAVTYQDPLISSWVVEGFEDSVSHEGLSVRVAPVEFIQFRAGVEWLLPTAVVAYLVKPYFESFLKEMGKDHYHMLKHGLVTVHSRIVEKYGDRIRRIGSEGKLELRMERYSPAYSIEAESSRDFTYKLLIQTDLDESELETVLEKYFELLSQEHGIDEESDAYSLVLNAKPTSHLVLVALNRDKGELEVVDPFRKN